MRLIDADVAAEKIKAKLMGSVMKAVYIPEENATNYLIAYGIEKAIEEALEEIPTVISDSDLEDDLK